MKRNNKKGFTIVELVIVIAVIAILAAVMIPTFSGLVDKANSSAVGQETRAALTAILVEKNADLSDGTYYVAYQKNTTDDIQWFVIEDNALVSTAAPANNVKGTVYTSNLAKDTETTNTETYGKYVIITADILDGYIESGDTAEKLADLSKNVEILFVED